MLSFKTLLCEYELDYLSTPQTEQIPCKLTEKASQDQMARQVQNIHLHLVLYAVNRRDAVANPNCIIFVFLCMSFEYEKNYVKAFLQQISNLISEEAKFDIAHTLLKLGKCVYNFTLETYGSCG